MLWKAIRDCTIEPYRYVQAGETVEADEKPSDHFESADGNESPAAQNDDLSKITKQQLINFAVAKSITIPGSANKAYIVNELLAAKVAENQDELIKLVEQQQ